MEIPNDLWNEILECLESYEDIRDGADGEPRPNAAMAVLQQIREKGLDPDFALCPNCRNLTARGELAANRGKCQSCRLDEDEHYKESVRDD